MSVVKRLGTVATIASLALIGVAAMPHQAKAWWHRGWGVGFVLPPVVVAPPVYAVPPVAYVPPPAPYYPAPRRIWIPPHWQGPYWVPGHWS